MTAVARCLSHFFNTAGATGGLSARASTVPVLNVCRNLGFARSLSALADKLPVAPNHGEKSTDPECQPCPRTPVNLVSGPYRPKLWQNLRATRQTELAETFPIHVVCDWIGNSRAVAQEHYLQVTDEHFEAAQNAHAQGSSEPQEESKPTVFAEQCEKRSEERRVGKECRSRWSPYH